MADIGTSIFDRPKPLVPKTLRRILEGLKKFAHEPMLMTHTSPGYCQPVTQPCSTLTTACHKSKVTPILMTYYGNGATINANESPCPTITTKDRVGLVSARPAISFIGHQFSRGHYSSLDQPLGTILTNPKAQLYSAFLVNPQYRNKGASVHAPAPTIVAAQKSYPLALCTAQKSDSPHWKHLDGDCPEIKELRDFMRSRGIGDVFLRMLKVPELKRIQGFPESYILAGNTERQKKFIGNSVVPVVVARWLQSMAMTMPEKTNFAKNPILA